MFVYSFSLFKVMDFLIETNQRFKFFLIKGSSSSSPKEIVTTKPKAKSQGATINQRGRVTNKYPQHIETQKDYNLNSQVVDDISPIRPMRRERSDSAGRGVIRGSRQHSRSPTGGLSESPQKYSEVELVLVDQIKVMIYRKEKSNLIWLSGLDRNSKNGTLSGRPTQGRYAWKRILSFKLSDTSGPKWIGTCGILAENSTPSCVVFRMRWEWRKSIGDEKRNNCWRNSRCKLRLSATTSSPSRHRYNTQTHNS